METPPQDAEKQMPPTSTSTIIDPEATAPGYSAPALIKWLVVLATSFAALTASFSSTSMFSAAREIAEEFDTTPEIINASSVSRLDARGFVLFES